MTKLVNEITINASVKKVWQVLVNVEELATYDPTVRKSTKTSPSNSGIGASRKVDMQDGKNWFKETTTVCKPHEALTYQLTACSFPVSDLKHSYSFQKIGNKTKVTQIMEYDMQYGFLGKLLDMFMVRKQTDSGIKKFFGGLKTYIEK